MNHLSIKFNMRRKPMFMYDDHQSSPKRIAEKAFICEHGEFRSDVRYYQKQWYWNVWKKSPTGLMIQTWDAKENDYGHTKEEAMEKAIFYMLKLKLKP